MNLRQTRRHFYGNSNADEKIKYKTEHPEEFPARDEGMTATQFLALPKKKTFDQLVDMRDKQATKAALFEKTQSLYNVSLLPWLSRTWQTLTRRKCTNRFRRKLS